MQERLCESLPIRNHRHNAEITAEQYRQLWQVIPGGRAGQPPRDVPTEDRPRLGYRDERDFNRNERPTMINQLSRMQGGEVWDDELGWVAYDLATSALADLYLEPITK